MVGGRSLLEGVGLDFLMGKAWAVHGHGFCDDEEGFR